MRTIPLTKGKITLVDDEDYDVLMGHNWSAIKGTHSHTWYAQRKTQQSYVVSTVWMHQQVMGFPEQQIDHINGDGLDNQKQNLRCATYSQQGMNSRPKKGRLYKGVFVDPRREGWFAQIRKDGVAKRLGTFATQIEAAIAYNRAAAEMFGEFARLNTNVLELNIEPVPILRRRKLNPDKVLVIRQRYQSGATPQELSDEFGVSEGLIYAVVQRRVWQHVL